MTYKLAVFDLDGTLLDTLEDLTDAVNYALKQKDYPLQTTTSVRSFLGYGIRNLIERSVPKSASASDIDGVFNAFKTYYKQHCTCKTHLYSGIEDALYSLQGTMKLAVLSNKADFAVQEIARQYFPPVFDFVAGERTGIPRKPDPQSLLSICKELDIDPAGCVYIGDSEVDVQTAANAGCACIAVTWGFRDADYLSKLSPDYLVDTVQEMSSILLA